MELLGYVAYFKKTAATKRPPYARVRSDIQRLLSKSEECLKKNQFSQNDYEMGRFAVCALIDETILNSSWHDKDQWQRELLQRVYYNTADAGEEFFKRLNSIGIHQREVREVYYLCLAMGFMGQYGNEKDKYLLEQVKASNLKVLIGSSVGIPSFERMDLFPEAYPSENDEIVSKRKGARFSPFTIIFIAGPVVLFLTLYIIYAFILNNRGNNFLGMVP
jgi:type VI secretion system protein ImpK